MMYMKREPDGLSASSGPSGSGERSRLLAPLLDKLAASDVTTRQQARNALVNMGAPALPALLQRLEEGEFLVRWEVVKALGEMRLRDSVPALIGALQDEEQDVRWLAAVALAGIGKEALPPLLETLIDRSDSAYLRQGAHHVLTIFQDIKLRKALEDVRDALGPMESDMDVIPAAERALKALRA